MICSSGNNASFIYLNAVGSVSIKPALLANNKNIAGANGFTAKAAPPINIPPATDPNDPSVNLLCRKVDVSDTGISEIDFM